MDLALALQIGAMKRDLAQHLPCIRGLMDRFSLPATSTFCDLYHHCRISHRVLLGCGNASARAVQQQEDPSRAGRCSRRSGHPVPF